MPRTLVKGSQVLDRSITSDDLATDSVITEKIKDGNVTCPKLEPGLCDRLLASPTPIARYQVLADIPEDTDFVIPGGLSYDIASFVERVAIYRNGQLLFNGLTKPTLDTDPTDVWPGTDTSTMLRFSADIRRGETIQVIIL